MTIKMVCGWKKASVWVRLCFRLNIHANFQMSFHMNCNSSDNAAFALSVKKALAEKKLCKLCEMYVCMSACCRFALLCVC